MTESGLSIVSLFMHYKSAQFNVDIQIEGPRGVHISSIIVVLLVEWCIEHTDCVRYQKMV